MIPHRRSDMRSAFLQHPVVRRLQMNRPGCPRETVRRLAFQTVENARLGGWSGPPYDMEVLASLRGMKVLIADWLGPDQDGCLVPGQPATIYHNRGISRNRARYTIAHEIAHTLLPESDTQQGERHWKYRHDGQSPVEQLCQVAASELLMPSDSLASSLAGRQESLSLARATASTFQVSVEAAARNIVDRSNTGCAMMVLALMNKPSEVTHIDQMAIPGLEPPAARKRLRILYGWISRSMDELYLPQYKSIPDASALYQLLEGEARSAVGAPEDWTELASMGAVFVEGTLIPGHERPRVLCFVRRLGDLSEI